jgi:hypothetical protein
MLDAHRGDYDAFLVAHGTDTMAYTAAALSLMLAGFRKPIVLTGESCGWVVVVVVLVCVCVPGALPGTLGRPAGRQGPRCPLGTVDGPSSSQLKEPCARRLRVAAAAGAAALRCAAEFD